MKSVPQEQHPESTKSSNTAGSTTSHASAESFSSSSTPPVEASSAFDFEYEIPVVFEMTTEDDFAMVHAINRLEDRLMMESPIKKRQSPRIKPEDEEILTDDFYEEVPNMEEHLRHSPVAESAVIWIPPKRKLDFSYARLMDEEGEEAVPPSVESEDDAFHRRSLAVHTEQQKRLGVIQMLLPWTHAIAARKQRHIHSRQFLRSSFVGMSLLMWPQMFSKNRATTLRSYNPTSLFRR